MKMINLKIKNKQVLGKFRTTYTHTCDIFLDSNREIGVSNREIFSRQKIFNFIVKNCYLQHRRSL